jgi:hypothetical protein
VVRTPYDYHVSIGGRRPGGQLLHPRHERARRVDDLRGSLFKLFLHLRCNTVSTNYGGLAAPDLHGFADGGDAVRLETLHLLFIVDQRPECANSVAVLDRVFDHVDRTLHSETKTVFVCQ